MKRNAGVFFHLCYLFMLAVYPACKLPAPDKNTDRKANSRITKTVRNITFIFPPEGFAFDSRDSIIDKCFDAIKHDLAIIHQNEYRDTITAQFVSSREEMKQYIGYSPSGAAFPQVKTIWFVANKELSPPIKHEFMHMITIGLWGQPPQETDWLKEGIAAYAENSCNGFTVEQIYAFFENKNMLLPIDSLTTHFYMQPEMIAYHQSAYISQYLIETFGIEKFALLWQSGFSGFQKIYGIRFQQIESDIKNKLKQKYRVMPNIDWNAFKTGCK
jgi:hypothetical protein